MHKKSENRCLNCDSNCWRVDKKGNIKCRVCGESVKYERS